VLRFAGTSIHEMVRLSRRHLCARSARSLGLMTAPPVLELFHREALRDRVALLSATQSRTYGEVAAEIDTLAAGLSARGVRKGDRVGIFVGNRPQFMPLLFATWRLGAIAAFVDIYNPAPRMLAWCNTVDAMCLILDEARLEEVLPHLGLLERCAHVFATCEGDLPAAIQPWSALHRAAPPPAVSVRGSDPLLIIQTSGTTALPKGIWHTLDSLQRRLDSHVQCPPMRADDVVCPMSPLSTVAGLNATSLPALAAGAKLLLLANAYDPASAFEQMAHAGATIVMAGPPRILGLANAAKARPELDRSRMRIGLSGGDKVPETVRRAWDETFGVPLLEGFGLSETLGGVLINMLGERDHAGNVGKPFPGVAVQLVDDDGRVVPDGPGELWCKCDFLFGGYWNDPQLTAEVMRDGWYKTGDVAERLPSGNYRILGRRDFLIMRATLNISPFELEAVIQRHPAVVDCLVAGFPSEQLGQDVEAFLVLREPLPLAALKPFLLEQLGPAFCPSRFWTTSQIPRTSMGKVDRRAAASLREHATPLTA
jgi:long-chain acyl-CoA synthetase